MLGKGNCDPPTDTSSFARHVNENERDAMALSYPSSLEAKKTPRHKLGIMVGDNTIQLSTLMLLTFI